MIDFKLYLTIPGFINNIIGAWVVATKINGNTLAGVVFNFKRLMTNVRE